LEEIEDEQEEVEDEQEKGSQDGSAEFEGGEKAQTINLVFFYATETLPKKPWVWSFFKVTFTEIQEQTDQIDFIKNKANEKFKALDTKI